MADDSDDATTTPNRYPLSDSVIELVDGGYCANNPTLCGLRKNDSIVV